jgi:hypothetical protein
MNDTERRQWILNDEGLYNLWKSSGLVLYEFIRQNRKTLDEAINNVTSGKKPAHYLAYGGSNG